MLKKFIHKHEICMLQVSAFVIIYTFVFGIMNNIDRTNSCIIKLLLSLIVSILIFGIVLCCCVDDGYKHMYY